MNQSDNERATALELVSFAREQGLDLEPIRRESMFQTDQRWAYFWRKWDGLPCSGPGEEEEGTLHYNMQGTVASLPETLGRSASPSQAAWSEAGTFSNIAQAFAFLKAWVLEARGVDELPERFVTRCGI